jgi:hypothetical protein
MLFWIKCEIYFSYFLVLCIDVYYDAVWEGFT